MYLLSDTTTGPVLGVSSVEHIEGSGVDWFKITLLECFNVGSSFVGGSLGWLVSSSEDFFVGNGLAVCVVVCVGQIWVLVPSMSRTDTCV